MYSSSSEHLLNSKGRLLQRTFIAGMCALACSPGTSIAQRYNPPGLCALDSNNEYESITLPISIGGEYLAGSTQTITIIAGDTAQPGGNQAFTGDTENVVLMLDTNADGVPEVLSSNSCTYDQGATPPGCSVTQNIVIPAVTEDTTFRGRVMLSFNDTDPPNGCGINGFGDHQDFLLVANVEETIQIADISVPEDGGPVTLTAVLSHDVADDAGFLPFTTDFVVTDGTATVADNDYTATNGTLSFNGQAGDTASITVNPVTDIVPEADETLTVSFQNLSNTTHGIDISDSAIVTLIDDDEAVDLDITKTVSDESPNIGDTVVFTLLVDNLGPDDAVGASVLDSVPAGLGSITPVSSPAGTSLIVSGNTVSWTGLDVTVGSPLQAQYSAVVLPP